MSVVMDDAVGEVVVGDEGQWSATLTYSDDSTVTSAEDATAFTWRSSDEAVMGVDDDGGYTALAQGAATITVTATQTPTLSDSVDVTVTAADVDYDFEMVIGNKKLSSNSTHYMGVATSLDCGETEGVFPSGSAISHCCTILPSSADGYQFIFRAEDGSRWAGAGAVTLTFGFEDESSLTTPLIPLNASETGYYLSDETTDYSADYYYVMYDHVGEICRVKVTTDEVLLARQRMTET